MSERTAFSLSLTKRLLLTVGTISLFFIFALPPAQAEKQPTPTFSPPGGNYSEPVTVTLFSPGAARITYTLDGSDPRLGGYAYSNPIKVSSSATVRAIASPYVYTGIECSDSASATYTFVSTEAQSSSDRAGWNSAMYITVAVIVIMAIVAAILYIGRRSENIAKRYSPLYPHPAHALRWVE